MIQGLDLSGILAELIGQAEHPIALTSNIRKIFNDYKDRLLQSSSYGLTGDVVNIVKDKFMNGMQNPFKSSFSNAVLAKVNELELKGSSHRQHVENLNTCITETMQMLGDIISHSNQLFGPQTAPSIYNQAVDCGLGNLIAKLKTWQYWQGTGDRPRGVDDLLLVASASGHLIAMMTEFRDSVDVDEDSFKQKLKEVTAFNKSVCSKILSTAADSVTCKMKPAMEVIDLLHLFHRFEQFFADSNITHAFHLASKKKLDGEELYQNAMEHISLQVMEAFSGGVSADVEKLPASVARQFLVDAMFLKDALEDLRCSKVDKLIVLEEQLRKRVDSVK